jgi:hypothetical protein
MSRAECIENLQLHNWHYGFCLFTCSYSTMSGIATLLAVHSILCNLPYSEPFREAMLVKTSLIRYHKGGTAQG